MIKYFLRHIFRPYSKHQWHIAGILFASYLTVTVVTLYYIPHSVELYPGFAFALCALFFGGLRLAPFVYLAALASGFAAGFSPSLLLILPFAATLQAMVGAYALRTFNFDPLFRRYRDTAYMLATVVTISFIEPVLQALGAAIQGETYGFVDWTHSYVATAFCFLILMPLILRWFTKPRFSRSSKDIIETIAIFSLLLAIDVTLFVGGIQTVIGVPLIYFLLIPLYFIALKLRPRFLTLALLITSVFAIAQVLMQANASVLAEQLFNTELSLIALSVTFFIITSLEEQLRVNTNLMLSQLSTLENAVSRVSSESRAKNDFIAILAHELRNPLAPVLSAIELLKLKGSRDPDDLKAFDMMMERMEAVQTLLNDLLDISRISEGKVAFTQSEVELEVVLKRSILSTDHHRKELHQRLLLRAPKTKLRIIGDPTRLEQIFSNLLTNASKYSDSGDTVTVTVKQKDDCVEIEVSDEGVGISSHALESIFMPFHQLEQGERTGKGLGIGLALVRSFVEMHGGSVIASSKGPGFGSSFRVTLPLLGRDTLLEAGDREYQSSSLKSRRGSLVLVVDDDDTTSGNVGRLLELEGSSVLYAYRSRQAIEQALSLTPDIVLINVDMRSQDGYKIAETLHRRGFKGHLIALSESPTKSLKGGATLGVFERYLLNPVGLSDLKNLLSELKTLQNNT